MNIVQKILTLIVAAVFISTCSYLVGFQKGKKNVQSSVNAAAVKELNKTIEDTNKKINSFNEQQKIDFDAAIKASEERQKIEVNSAATKEDLQKFFAKNQELYKNCVLPKDQLERLNRSIKQ